MEHATHRLASPDLDTLAALVPLMHAYDPFTVTVRDRDTNLLASAHTCTTAHDAMRVARALDAPNVRVCITHPHAASMHAIHTDLHTPTRRNRARTLAVLAA
jgi:hypothetical protein